LVEKAYNQPELEGVRKESVLTGYVMDSYLESRPYIPLKERAVDIGYRGRRVQYWLGELGQDKVRIAGGVLARAAAHGLRVDISVEEDARIYGEGWFDFLRNCKAVLVTESGASIWDYNGDAKRRCEAYQQQHPGASFEEVHGAVLEMFEGNLVSNTVSPRLFEAIAMRTPLIMFEGWYDGVVQPHLHYLPLKKDFSNFAEIVKRLRDTSGLEAMASRAYDDIIASEKYSAARFIEKVDAVLDDLHAQRAAGAPAARKYSLYNAFWLCLLRIERMIELRRLLMIVKTAWYRVIYHGWRLSRHLLAPGGRLAKRTYLAAKALAASDEASGVTLLVYHSRGAWPLRASRHDHLFCFARHSSERYLYVNTAYPVPEAMAALPIRAIIFHTSFLSLRWSPEAFVRVARKVAFMKALPVTKIAIPQDEFLNTDALCDFIAGMNVTHVCSNAGEKDWPVIYQKLPPACRPEFHKALTGYVEEGRVRAITARDSYPANRPLDVCYRAWQAAYWLGSQARHKVRIAAETARLAPSLGLKADISLDSEDTLTGRAWLDFLRSSKATIGCEGGASVCDHDGSLRRAVEAYLQDRPQASYDEIHGKFLKERDGEIALSALSPRHLEAALTKTYQILVEGEYGGVMKAGVHYYPVKPDYSNLRAALLTIRDDAMRQRIVENAFNDLILSGWYSYGSFVRQVEGLMRNPPVCKRGVRPRPRYYALKFYDWLLWRHMICEAIAARWIRGTRLAAWLTARYRRRQYGIAS
ncbi:MAG: hypothetical protein KGJ21_06535, partial [Pseudomonadota bacterium]|nr:hypothetical protein [Pseudomonadota bacterium]